MSCNWLDLLFRVGLYRGIRVDVPDDLVKCDLVKDTAFVREFMTYLDGSHELAGWLSLECDGPWRIALKRPYYSRKPYIAFARHADAVMFRIMAA